MNPRPQDAFCYVTTRGPSWSVLALLGLAVACKNGSRPFAPDGPGGDGQGGDSLTDGDDTGGEGSGGKPSGGSQGDSGGSGGQPGVGKSSGGHAAGGTASGGSKSTGGAGAGGSAPGSTGGSSPGTGGSESGVVLSGTVVWQNDFEFPGPDWTANTWLGDRDSNGDGRPEFLSYIGTAAAELDYHEWNVMHKDQLDAWLAPGQTVDKSVIRGDFVYTAQTKQPFSASHRAYPSVHFDETGGGGHPDYPEGVPSPMVNQWWVWWDPEGGVSNCWKHLATWSNNTDWTVHVLLAGRSGDHYSLTFKNGDKVKVVNEFNQDKNIVPIGQWFRVTAYIDYSQDNGGGDNDGFAAYWLNDTLVGTVSGNYLSPSWANSHTTFLKRAHWGLYAEGSCDSGRWIEDDNLIWTLDEPMTNFEFVPLPPPR